MVFSSQFSPSPICVERRLLYDCGILNKGMAEASSLCLLSFSVKHSNFLSNVDANRNLKKGVQKFVPRCQISRVQCPGECIQVHSNPTAFSCMLLILNRNNRNMSTSTSRSRLRRSSMRVCSSRRDEDDNVSRDDEFRLYPWDSSFDNDALQWVQEDTITLFTTDGLMQIGGSVVPRHINPSGKKQGRLGTSQRYRRFHEEDYMDPNQGLCLGAIFDIAATNGLDLGRRFCVFGFCRSIEMLSDVVEDTVLEQGGEVVAAEKESKGGLHEKLTMKVAVPLLWGIPPAADRLHFAIRTGGGIVEKIYWQWNFL